MIFVSSNITGKKSSDYIESDGSNETTLDNIREGSTAVIKRMSGTRSFISRACSRGFTSGTTVRVLQNFKMGPLIVYLKDSQVAIGRNEAKKIFVGE